jgi:multiple sugar transport system permease protein
LKIDWVDDKYDFAVFDDEINDYELLIQTDDLDKLRIFLKRNLSIQRTNEEIDRDFSVSKNGEPLLITYKKDLLYNYKTFFSITNNAGKAVLNSVIAAGFTIIISLFFGSLAGYAMARYKFKGRERLSLLLLVVRMFPAVAVAIPMLVYLIKMNLDNTMIGLAIVYSVGNIALTAWITSSIFTGINVELEEASYVFGATKFKTFIKITLPLAVPGLIACSMYAFLAAWNDSITALILSNNNPTLSLVIYKAIGSSSAIQLSAAGAVILIMPALVFTFIIKNYINQLWGEVKL